MLKANCCTQSAIRLYVEALLVNNMLENRAGSNNLGLTALSAVQAKALAKQELRRLGWQ
jgi:hypothetical protein